MAKQLYPRVLISPPLPVRRMGPSDIVELGPWLSARLQEKHKTASVQACMQWLQSALQSNENWMVRSGNAVAMARLVRRELEPRPSVQEVFVLAQEGGLDAAADLYATMARWALQMEAASLEIESQTDVVRAEIAKRLGPSRPIETRVVRFP